MAPPVLPDVPPDQTDDGFLGELMALLPAGGWGAAAWGRFWSTAWQRHWTNIRARPRRHASTWRWLLLAWAIGIVVLVVSRPSAGALAGSVTWLLGMGGWAWLHQGLIRTMDGTPIDHFGLANGLTLLRIVLAPLMIPALAAPVGGTTVGVGLCAFLVALAATDFLDGQAARRMKEETRLGRALDPVADIVFLLSLAFALREVGVLPETTYGAIMVRYPGALGIFVLFYFVRGPVRVVSTWPGKITNATAAALLGLAACLWLVQGGLDGAPWMAIALQALGWLVAANFLWLMYLGLREVP